MAAAAGLNVCRAGSGEPSLLFVHGYGCAVEDWDSQVAALSDRFTCITFDLPGHGGSAHRTETSVADLAAAMNEVRAQSGGELVLVGHSLGCKVIREAYCQSPDRIAGLIFIDGGFYDNDPGRMQEGARLYIEINGFAAFIRDYFGAVARGSNDPDWRDYVIKRGQRLDPSAGRDIYLSAVAFDEARGEETLAQISVPVLVLQSSRIDRSGLRVAMEDGVVTPFMDRVRRLVPHAEIVVITGSSHFPMRDKAEEVSARIRQFAEAAAR